MKALVTGSSGHLGEAMMRTLGDDAIGLDVVPGKFTAFAGSILDRAMVRRCMRDAQVVFHTATLHKPHIATHSRQEFIDINVTGTLNLLEEAAATGVQAFVHTSTTSVFGGALIPPSGAPAAWVTETTVPVPKNIYGVTKSAAEDLCQLFHRNHGLPCIVLRTSRFFPEEDDDAKVRDAFSSENIKTNEFLHRRVDIEDVVSAHCLAAQRAAEIGFGKYIISATTPFAPRDMNDLRTDAAEVVRRYVPEYESEYSRRGWKMYRSIDRVYVNERARQELGWRPRYDFQFAIENLRAGRDIRSPLTREIGSKGYHAGSSRPQVSPQQ